MDIFGDGGYSVFCLLKASLFQMCFFFFFSNLFSSMYQEDKWDPLICINCVYMRCENQTFLARPSWIYAHLAKKGKKKSENQNKQNIDGGGVGDRIQGPQISDFILGTVSKAVYSPTAFPSPRVLKHLFCFISNIWRMICNEFHCY